jgi:SRSO17 transposase
MDGKRKSVEPTDARLGVDGNRQALAIFVTTSPRDPAHIRTQPAWRTETVLRPKALVFDDTGFLKDATASPYVSWQYVGTAGKVTNWHSGELSARALSGLIRGRSGPVRGANAFKDGLELRAVMPVPGGDQQ